MGRYTYAESSVYEAFLTKTQSPAAPARVPRAPAEESTTEESLWAHAGRLVHRRLGAMARRVLDAGIELLQALRKRTGDAQDSSADAKENRARPGRPGPGGGRDTGPTPDEAAADAPAPKRRLRAFLINFSVLLAGGMAGGALAYELLAKLLEQATSETRRLELAASKLSKSAASNQQKLAEAQAKRIEAEEKLEASLAEKSKLATEQQKKIEEAEKRQQSLPAADRSANDQRSSAAGRNERNKPPPRSGDCSVSAGNIDGLKDCLKNFNR